MVALASPRSPRSPRMHTARGSCASPDAVRASPEPYAKLSSDAGGTLAARATSPVMVAASRGFDASRGPPPPQLTGWVTIKQKDKKYVTSHVRIEPWIRQRASLLWKMQALNDRLLLDLQAETAMLDPTSVGFAYGGVFPGTLHSKGALHEVHKVYCTRVWPIEPMMPPGPVSSPLTRVTPSPPVLLPMRRLRNRYGWLLQSPSAEWGATCCTCDAVPRRGPCPARRLR